MDRLNEFNARFSEREARAVALEASAGAAIADALQALERLRRAGALLRLVDQSETTQRHRATERATVPITQRLVRAVEAIPRAMAEWEIDRLDDRLRAHAGALSREQRAAIELAL